MAHPVVARSAVRAGEQNQPEATAWAQLDKLLVLLLQELCHVVYDSFPCTAVDNPALNIRCAHGGTEAIAPRPLIPRDVLPDCCTLVKPGRNPTATEWASAFKRAADSLTGDIPSSAPLLRGFSGRDPQEQCLGEPNIDKETGYIRWFGEAVVEHSATHWGCIMVDRTAFVDQRPDRDQAEDYLLRSELLSCLCLMRRELNETLWQDEFLGWKLRTGFEAVKTTVVCFEDVTSGGVVARVIEASYDPMTPKPTLKFAIRASYGLDTTADPTCSEDTARSILGWIVCPDGLPGNLINPKQKGTHNKLPKHVASECCFASSGSSTSSESQSTTTDSPSSPAGSEGTGD